MLLCSTEPHGWCVKADQPRPLPAAAADLKSPGHQEERAVVCIFRNQAHCSLNPQFWKLAQSILHSHLYKINYTMHRAHRLHLIFANRLTTLVITSVVTGDGDLCKLEKST